MSDVPPSVWSLNGKCQYIMITFIWLGGPVNINLWEVHQHVLRLQTFWWVKKGMSRIVCRRDSLDKSFKHLWNHLWLMTSHHAILLQRLHKFGLSNQVADSFRSGPDRVERPSVQRPSSQLYWLYIPSRSRRFKIFSWRFQNLELFHECLSDFSLWKHSWHFF